MRLKELKKLSGELEIDEALFGGHWKGKHGWGSEGKNLAFGMYQRNGRVITFPVSDRKHDTLIPLIKQHTKKGSLYYTDDHTAYATLNLIGKHQIILHGKEEYVRDDATHINGVEGFWSYAKTWSYHYRGVPKQYFELPKGNRIQIQSQERRYLQNTCKDDGRICSKSLGITLIYMDCHIFTHHDIK